MKVKYERKLIIQEVHCSKGKLISIIKNTHKSIC